MSTVFWTGNGIATQQVETGTVNSVVTGSVIAATINGKVVNYTVLSTDTAATAATALQGLLSNSQLAPPEFNQITWANPSSGVITATAKNAGVPFAGMSGGLVFSGTGGASVTQTHTTPNASPSDVGAAANWMRAGSAALPQPGDDMVVADSSVPLLYNLTALSGIALNSYTRYQSFTGTIGLPENNPNGYYEYLPTYFQLAGPAGGVGSPSSSSGPGAAMNVLLGFGQTGTGPSRERYNFGGSQYAAQVLNSGSPQDDYAVRILGTNPANNLQVMNTSVGVAMLPGEVSLLGTASADGGGTLALGPNVTFSGTLTVTGAGAILNCAPTSVVAQQGAQIVQGTVAALPILNYPSIKLLGGSRCTWLSGSNVVSLVLQTSSVFDKSQSLAAMVMTNLTMDADTCQLLDPFGTITFVNPVTLNNALQSGPIQLPPGKTFKIV